MATRKISAPCVVPVSGDPLRNGVLTFNEQGALVEIMAGVSNPWAVPGVEYYNGAIVPGFVNTHCHLELSYMKDALPEATGLPGFVKRIMETKFTYSEEVQRKAVAETDRLFWESGVQAVGDISNTTVSFDTKERSRVKYVTFLEIFNVLMGADYRDTLAGGAGLLAEARRLGLEAYVTLHATYSESKKLFEEYPRAEGTQCISIHYMESPDDDLIFKNQGGFYKLFQEKGVTLDFLDEESSTNRIVSHIPSDRRVLLVHNTYVTQADIDALTARYPRLSWALCPRSNYYIGRNYPNTALMTAPGNDLNLTVGTDSLSSNRSLQMIEELKCLVRERGVKELDAIRWATLNGAKALDLDHEIGSFDVGKSPGAVLLEGVADGLRFTPRTTSRRLV
ncbi:MAG: amidohydrolase family protein [Rikenellaceae bacterium]|jgi:cytosine/adenosine deaminase-related metal-dependent hydrolase|nr:amidohydrolase family protein [Rikenellaceae bacterium]